MGQCTLTASKKVTPLIFKVPPAWVERATTRFDLCSHQYNIKKERIFFHSSNSYNKS
jgi:hypothetical protein